MNTIKIFNFEYEVLGTIERINIADSFVTSQNKIGTANGEAKLYIGQDDTKLQSFFGERGFNVNCFLLKEDLLNYLDEVRAEHLAPTQDYREKENLPQIWDKKREKVLSQKQIIEFNIIDQKQIQGLRLYVNSTLGTSSEYKLLREIPLPIISHIDIIKLRDIDNGSIKYYFSIYSDYKDTIQVEEEVSTQDLDYEPFDPEQISIDTKKISMDSLLRRLIQGTINLNPDFQRNEVWTTEKKCQLIESLMLKIPLPMFYVSLHTNGDYNVVDGLQRLSTIRDFILGKDYLETRNKEKKGFGFKLEKLEFWGDKFNGFYFNNLPTYIENRLLETEFTFTLINSGTPEVVKRNIFKRVNRGGEPLTDQEIRHALYVGESTRLIKKLSQKEEFLKVTDYSIKSNRMLDREFVLRLLAFLVRDYTAYPKNGNMDSFLSDTMMIINSFPHFNNIDLVKRLNSEVKVEDVRFNSIEKVTDLFTLAMNRALQIFGEHAFRKSFQSRRKTPINKALFEVWGVLLSQVTEEQFSTLLSNKNVFLNEYINSYLIDYKFDEIISRNALKQSSVFDRHKKLKSLLQQFI